MSCPIIASRGPTPIRTLLSRELCRLGPGTSWGVRRSRSGRTWLATAYCGAVPIARRRGDSPDFAMRALLAELFIASGK